MSDKRYIAAHRGAWYDSLDETNMIAFAEIETDEDEVVERVPFKWEVCSTCEGRGKHVNPNVDAHGITGDEWAEWGDEEQSAYLGGRYDVTCYECGGRRVVAVPDFDRITDEARRRDIEEHLISVEMYAAERANENEKGY
jgi:hypothetical protein